MKTYDTLSKKDKDKFNAMILCTLPYVISLHAILMIYSMLMLMGAVLVCFALVVSFIFFFFGLILIAGGLLMYVVMRIFTEKYKKQIKQYFGIKDEEELFKD